MDLLLLAVAAVVAVLGVAAGRVLNVLAHRVPRSDPPSGALRTATLAVRAPWVEVGTALLLAVVVLRVGLSPPLAAWLWFALGAVLLTVIDLQHLLLPNRVLLPLTAGGVLLLAGSAAATGDWAGLGRGLLAAVAVAGALFVLALVHPAGLGMGDVKLGLLLGLYLGPLGWPAVVAGVFVAFVAQAVVALGLLLARRAGRRTDLPFGPALLAGVLAVLLLSSG